MNDEKFHALQKVDWGEVGKQLLAVAINYSQKYVSIGYQGCDDIVQDVIVKTLSGQRSWDPDRGELLPWLKWCVKSEIDNSAKKRMTKNEVLLVDQDDSDDFRAGASARNAIILADESSFNPETILLQKERGKHVKQEITQIYAAVEGDEALEDLVLAMQCLIDESETTSQPSRRDLAEYLNSSENEVNNRVKRLRRRLPKMRVN